MTNMTDTVTAILTDYVERWNAYDAEYLGGGFALDNYLLMTNFPVTSIDDLEGRNDICSEPAGIAGLLSEDQPDGPVKVNVGNGHVGGKPGPGVFTLRIFQGLLRPVHSTVMLVQYRTGP